MIRTQRAQFSASFGHAAVSANPFAPWDVLSSLCPFHCKENREHTNTLLATSYKLALLERMYLFTRIKQNEQYNTTTHSKTVQQIFLHDMNDGAPARTSVSVDGIHERLRNGFKQYIWALKNNKHVISLAYENCLEHRLTDWHKQIFTKVINVYKLMHNA